MKKPKKPKAPNRPVMLTMDQWADAGYKTRTTFKPKQGQSLTDVVRDLCLALGQENPDQVKYSGKSAYPNYGEHEFFSLKITPELKSAYNEYLISYQRAADRYTAEMNAYHTQLENWKQAMINAIKGEK